MICRHGCAGIPVYREETHAIWMRKPGTVVYFGTLYLVRSITTPKTLLTNQNRQMLLQALLMNAILGTKPQLLARMTCALHSWPNGESQSINSTPGILLLGTIARAFGLALRTAFWVKIPLRRPQAQPLAPPVRLRQQVAVLRLQQGPEQYKGARSGMLPSPTIAAAI